MVRFLGMMAAAASALTPMAARAADWWWVAGEPGAKDAWFVDADSISATGSQRSFQMLRIAADRSRNPEEGVQVDCERATSDAVQRFVCAAPDQRNAIGAMLGPVSPEAAARTIFETPGGQTAGR